MSRFVIPVLVVVAVTTSSRAESSQNEWEFAIAPYLWAAGMDGSIGIANFEQDVDVAFSDIIDNLDFAFMGHFDMRNEHWVLMSDLVFVDLGHEEDLVQATVTAGLDMTLFEVAGGYRVSRVFTILAGARWVDMATGIDYSGTLIDDEVAASKDWIDPLIGAHAFIPVSDKWWIGLLGDVGGFGVGSELTWHAYANVGFRLSHLVSIVLGYHAIDIDYEDGEGLASVKLDVTVSGPQLGVVFSF